MMLDTRRAFYTPLLLAALVFTVLTMPVAAQTPATTIEDAGGETLWQLNEDGGFAVFGEYNTGTIPTEGAGARLMWYPAKAAFRAGGVTGTRWDDNNIGKYSVALGLDAEASNDYAIAIGPIATASGRNSIALGYNTTSNSTSSVALGSSSTASGYISTAMGHATMANGFRATAMGFHTIAASDNSLSIGQFNSANTSQDNTRLVVGNGNGGANRSDALVLDLYGNLTIAGSLTESSDRRLKTAIAPLEAGTLERLAAIRPVRYRFRDTTRHPAGEQIGLLAQEVQAHFPALVSKGASGYLSLSYTKLTAVLVKGIQELESENEALRTEVDTLREHLDHMTQLEARLAALEAERADRQHAGWAWPAGMLLGLVLAGGVAWHRRP